MILEKISFMQLPITIMPSAMRLTMYMINGYNVLRRWLAMDNENVIYNNSFCISKIVLVNYMYGQIKTFYNSIGSI